MFERNAKYTQWYFVKGRFFLWSLKQNIFKDFSLKEHLRNIEDEEKKLKNTSLFIKVDEKKQENYEIIHKDHQEGDEKGVEKKEHQLPIAYWLINQEQKKQKNSDVIVIYLKV